MLPEKNGVKNRFMFGEDLMTYLLLAARALKNTAERVLPYFNSSILPKLLDGENILVAAHGNSLRSLVMQLDNLSKEEVIALEIPTGAPIIYTFDGSKEPIAKENLFE